MKAKALTKFYDTEAKVVRQQGDVFSITPARFNEITLKGRFIEAYEAPAKPAVADPVSEETESNK